MIGAMDTAQLKDQAARVEQGLDQLRQLHSEVGAHLSKIKRLDPANHPAEASSHESLLVPTQLSLLESYVKAAVTQLSSVESGLSGAVDALTAAATPPPANSSAAAETDQQPQARRPSYRLVKESGCPPELEEPARRRLSCDDLFNVFGHLQPWELTRYRRPLGRRLFTQSAASYAKLVIDCEDDTARPMWAAMPLAVAQRWGKRATNIREIKRRRPVGREAWCRGTWVALVEGHASGRAAMAAKQKREREGTAAAAAARQADGCGQSADDGTLEVLSFEAVWPYESNLFPDPLPSSDLPPAPTSPIHLPALKTVNNIPLECISARADRQWRTPAVTTLSVGTDLGQSSYGLKEWKGLNVWVGGCEAIEVLDLKNIYFASAAGLLSALPADGKSLAALRTLRGVSMHEVVRVDTNGSGIDMLRDVMVARGAKRSVCEVKITVRCMPSLNGAVTWSGSAARLIEAVAAPEVVWEEVFALNDDGTSGRIDAELLSLSQIAPSRSTGTPAAQKLIGGFVKTAGTVTYSGRDESIPAAITDDAFAAAHTLRLVGGALAKKTRAVEVASGMPSLSHIDASAIAPVREVWQYLERLQTAWESRGRGERSLSSVCVSLSADALTFTDPQHRDHPCLWHRDTTKLPPIEEVHVDVKNTVADDQFEAFYSSMMTAVTSFSDKLKGHKRTQIKMTFGSPRRVEQPFLAQLVGTGLCKVSMLVSTLSVERGTPDT
ncbi:unnamed protein product [Vitrella brassicaformis CCMP3155]|uniref:Uncharacterized protein n=1 Tax=Vitrella brassicaformis (strain CCMP3155) TaxID=1169540 RepID=A0A0G4FCJ5_VITBC|nr:unnamed protein product [Vitrella brassicaformis CCMP3155]|eukprot:CEM10278.1 unnamed protein product [Vitrella brassicaformis CCMP3155]